MIKKKFRQCAALLVAVIILLVQGAPVFAVETSKVWEGMVEEVTVSLYPNSQISKIYGPDVDENGMVTMKIGEKYNFTVEQMLDESEANPGTVSIAYALHDVITTSIFPISHEEWGRYDPEQAHTVLLHYKDVSIVPVPLEMYGDESLERYQYQLRGQLELEIHTVVYSSYQFEYPAGTTKVEGKGNEFTELIYNELIINEEEHLLEEPINVTYRCSYSFKNLQVSVDSYMNNENQKIGSGFVFPVPEIEEKQEHEEAFSWTIEKNGEIKQMNAYQGEKNISTQDYRYYYNCFNVYHNFAIYDVKFAPYRELSDNNSNAMVITTVGAAALGLGSSVTANVLTGVSPQNYSISFGRKREDDDLIELTVEPPELPKEDTPDVSMSIYKPFKELVNTKGATADLMLNIECAESLDWHFIPTAVCPDGLKTVIPTVVKIGQKATLVLTLTGEELKKPHTTVYITVIAWAETLDGKIVKTSAVSEVALHQKGLEAMYADDGSLKVIVYTDSNLDGIAEIRNLSEDEYFLKKKDEHTMIVEAKVERYGCCELKEKKI